MSIGNVLVKTAGLAGDKVVFEGQIYECLIDNNSWSPIDYPPGWTLVESA